MLIFIKPGIGRMNSALTGNADKLININNSPYLEALACQANTLRGDAAGDRL